MGRAPCCDKANVKRGPWSPEEDATLRNYLLTHGTGGNWISLPQRAGLKRCGKSCRLRWLNYLRPDIKHGAFSEEEDSVIVSLFYKMGSRWSVIAANLPGRTDNDVKNHWNTKLKKKLFAGGSNNPTLIHKFNSVSIPNTDVLTLSCNNNNNYDYIFNNHPSIFKASSSSSTPTTPTYVDNFNHLCVPFSSFSALLAQCTTTTTTTSSSPPMSLFPNFTSLSSLCNNLDHPYNYNSTHDPVPCTSSSRYPLHQSSSGAAVTDKVGPPEEASSVSASSSAVYGSSLDQDDPFLAELGFGFIQEVMMNPATCSYGDQEDVKPHQGLGQSVVN